MKKVLAIFILGLIIFGASAFAQSFSQDEPVNNLVKEALKAKGVDEEKINNVKEVDFKNLPKEINLKNIDETNLAMYEVNVTNENKPVYIITASKKLFKETVQKIAQKIFLNFGFDGEITKTTFLKTASGVTTSLEKGYVMTRDGSITGLSTNLEVLNDANTAIEIILYKNSEEVGFRNTIIPDSIGVYKDYDTISSNTLNFEKGDVISLKINFQGEIKVKDVISLLEIELN